MCEAHWQILQDMSDCKRLEGQAEAVGLAQVPAEVIKAAVDSSNLTGTGFYGVDL